MKRQRRGDLRHHRQPVQAPGLGPLHAAHAGGNALPARLRLARRRQADGADEEQGKEGVSVDRPRRCAGKRGERGGGRDKPAAAAPDPSASVVVVEIEGEPEAVMTPLRQNSDGSIKLDAVESEI